ncbi:MAG: hypothetical protein K2N88_05150 [Muribaculaceae bacterium]|nr:hypothetical protein [Muribaculaceae bacterium]
MSETLELKNQPLSGVLDMNDSVFIESGGTLRRVTLGTLAKAVRDTIKVGGRNLLKDTANFVINTTGTKWLSSKIVDSVLDLNSMAPLTFSCKYRKIGNPIGRIAIGAIRGSDWWDRVGFDADTLPVDGVIVKTFEPNKSATQFSLFAQSQSGVELYNFKLERGNMATDWSPAPEDLLPQLGGVIYCPLNRYIVLQAQKGGLRNERSDGNYQRCAEGSDDRCNSISRIRQDNECLDIRYLRGKFCNRRHPRWGIQIRNLESIKDPTLLRTCLYSIDEVKFGGKTLYSKAYNRRQFCQRVGLVQILCNIAGKGVAA